MTWSSKGKFWRLIFLITMAAILLLLFFKAQSTNPDVHNSLTSDIRELQARDIELGETVLQNHFQLLHNYDEVVFTMRRMQALSAALALRLKDGWLPDTPEIKQQLGEIQQQIDLKAGALEEFKSDNAVLKTALIYLPVMIGNVESQLLDESQAYQHKFNSLLRDALLMDSNQNVQASEALKRSIAEVEQVVPALPGPARASAALSVLHAKNILDSQKGMAKLISQLSPHGDTHIGTKLEQLYLHHYKQQQRSASLYRFILLLVAMLLLGYAFYTYYEVLENAEQLRIAATAFDTHESLMITDVNGVIVRVNQGFSESTGYSSGEVVGLSPRIFKSGRHDAAFYRKMWESIQRTGAWQGEIWDRRKNGEIYPKWLSISAVKGVDGVTTHYVSSHIDITERKAAEDAIQRLAYYDHLTHLPNRLLLLDRLQQALASSARNGRTGALLFIDLDNFKS